MHRLAAIEQKPDAFYGYGVVRMVGLSAAKKHIGIDKNAHLAALGIEILSADRFVGKRRRVREFFGRLPPCSASFGGRHWHSSVHFDLLFKQMLQVYLDG
jgi:hypothetical protein